MQAKKKEKEKPHLLSLGPEDKLGLVLLESGDILGQGSLRPVLTSVINSNSNSLGEVLGDASFL